MTVDIMTWPELLRPGAIEANPVAFSRSGGRSLGGIERTIRTDRGYWSIKMSKVALYEAKRRRVWNAVRSKLNGRSGLIIVPVYSFDTAPVVDGVVSDGPFDGGATFGDGTLWSTNPGGIRMNSVASIGATVVTLRRIYGENSLAGIRFSYMHGLYETGAAINVAGDIWQVPVFPAIRAMIPADAELNVDGPTCLCHLASDREMDVSLDASSFDLREVGFVEAVDFWSDLAAGHK